MFSLSLLVPASHHEQKPQRQSRVHVHSVLCFRRSHLFFSRNNRVVNKNFCETFVQNSRIRFQIQKMAFGGRECVWLILCFLLPPLAVYVNANQCTNHVVINLILCFFGWIPGCCHAFWYCFFRDIPYIR
ncbi:UPF0057 membrane protein F47B7.1 [Aphelenchoides besseyi]|nr:UPF0057 membrane protein F47B7.1 [Aphelenchoides besseyi]